MLVCQAIEELDRGAGLTGTILLEADDPVGPRELWGFEGREVLEAVRMADRKLVPLSMKHVDHLLELGLIDLATARRLAVIAVR